MRQRKNRFKLFVRIRPTAASYPGSVRLIDKKIVEITRPGLNPVRLETDGIFSNTTQRDVYQRLSQLGLVKNLLQGYNCCVICYGVTTAGKSYTLHGWRTNYDQRGLIPRVFADLFQEIGMLSSSHSVKVKISALQLYSDYAFDLLNPSGVDIQKPVAIHDMVEVSVSDEEDALCLLFLALAHELTLKKKRKDNGNFDHFIFTIILEMKSLVHSDGKQFSAQLKFVELSGAVGILTEPVTKQQLIARETITLLEHNLANAFHCPSINKPACRRCKLSYVLKDVVCGKTQTYIMLNVRFENDYMKASLQTLLFAQRLSKVEVKPMTIAKQSAATQHEQLLQNLKCLKLELYRRDLICDRKPLNYLIPTDGQRKKIFEEVQDYLQEKIPEIHVTTNMEIQTAFGMMRECHKNVSRQSQLEQQFEKEKQSVEQASIKEQKKFDGDQGVGVLDGKGFGIGVVPSDKKVVNKLLVESIYKLRVLSDSKIESGSTMEESVSSEEDTAAEEMIAEDDAMDSTLTIHRLEAFEDFKRRSGKHWNELFLQHKMLTERKKVEFNKLILELRLAKQEIQATRQWYNELVPKAQDFIIMEELSELLERIETLNQQHSMLAEESIKALGEVRAMQRIGHKKRQDFMQAFDSWYERKLIALRYQQILCSQEYQTSGSPSTARQDHRKPCKTMSSISPEEAVYRQAKLRVDHWLKHSAIRVPTKGKRPTNKPPVFDFLQKATIQF